MAVKVEFGTVEEMSDKKLTRAAAVHLSNINHGSTETGGRDDQIIAEVYLKEVQSRGLMDTFVDKCRRCGIDGDDITIGNTDE